DAAGQQLRGRRRGVLRRRWRRRRGRRALRVDEHPSAVPVPRVSHRRYNQVTSRRATVAAAQFPVTVPVLWGIAKRRCPVTTLLRRARLGRAARQRSRGRGTDAGRLSAGPGETWLRPPPNETIRARGSRGMTCPIGRTAIPDAREVAPSGG